jgi:curved DNA-binding protein CbpA
MNPYEILEVSPGASDAEIKAAYRKAVKKHHPDLTGNNNESIILINEAYELLTDGERKKKYDVPIRWEYTPAPPDPVENYKSQFRERKKAEARARVEFEKKVFHKLFYVNLIIAAFTLLLILDQILPTVSTTEFTLDSQHQNPRHDEIETENQEIYIPRSAGLDHTFIITESIHVEQSPIFNIPTHAIVRYGDSEWSFVPAVTVFSFGIPFHYVILFLCVLTLSRRTFGPVAFSLCFAPSIMLFFMVTIVM